MTEKKRYYITLTQEKAFLTKRYLKDLGLPPQHFSILLDEYLDMINPMLEMLCARRRQGEQVTIFDVLSQTSSAANEVLKK